MTGHNAISSCRSCATTSNNGFVSGRRAAPFAGILVTTDASRHTSAASVPIFYAVDVCAGPFLFVLLRPSPSRPRSAATAAAMAAATSRAPRVLRMYVACHKPTACGRQAPSRSLPVVAQRLTAARIISYWPDGRTLAPTRIVRPPRMQIYRPSDSPVVPLSHGPPGRAHRPRCDRRGTAPGRE